VAEAIREAMQAARLLQPPTVAPEPTNDAVVEAAIPQRGTPSSMTTDVVPTPLAAFKAMHSVGDRVRGEVVRATSSHVYLEYSGGVTGVINVWDLAWERVEDASAFCPVGSLLTAEIIRFDDEHGHVQLSRKKALPNPYFAYKASHTVGQSVTAEVRDIIPVVAFVDLGGGVQGSIQISQLAVLRVNHPSDVVQVDQRIVATIVGFNDASEQVELSLRQSPTPASSYPVSPPRPVSQRVPPVPPPAPTPYTSQSCRSMIGEGSTIAEAVAAACTELGVSANNVSYEVLDHGEPRRLFRSGRPFSGQGDSPVDASTSVAFEKGD
jgi:predicted RNA-binding protein with RPS1 domain